MGRHLAVIARLPLSPPPKLLATSQTDPLHFHLSAFTACGRGRGRGRGGMGAGRRSSAVSCHERDSRGNLGAALHDGRVQSTVMSQGGHGRRYGRRRYRAVTPSLPARTVRLLTSSGVDMCVLPCSSRCLAGCIPGVSCDEKSRLPTVHLRTVRCEASPSVGGLASYRAGGCRALRDTGPSARNDPSDHLARRRCHSLTRAAPICRRRRGR